MTSYGGRERACSCVYRKIFDICYSRFRRHADSERISVSSVYCDGANGPRNRHRYGFRNEEYCADFLHIAAETLGDTLLYRIFRWRYVYGADFRLVNRKLKRQLSDRSIFHDFYRIEELLGRAFRETYPYALFPVDEYFGGTVRKGNVIPFPTTVPA